MGDPGATLGPGGDPTPRVTVVVPTRAGEPLNEVERRRIRRVLLGTRRRLERVGVPAALRRKIADDIVAAVAEVVPTDQGLAVVAGPGPVRVMHLDHPVRFRVLVGAEPSAADVVDHARAHLHTAVLHVTPGSARIVRPDPEGRVVARVQRLGWPVAPGTSQAQQIAGAALGAIEPDTVLYLAGEVALVSTVAARLQAAGRRTIVLAGDQRYRTPGALLAMASRVAARRTTLAGPQDDPGGTTARSAVVDARVGTEQRSARSDGGRSGEPARRSRHGAAATGGVPPGRRRRGRRSAAR